MPVATQGSPLAADSLQAMVECWTQRSGRPRRFQPGDSTDFYAIKAWLGRRGHALSATKGRFVVKARGRSRRNLLWRDVMNLVDDLRKREGLEPFAR